MLAKFNS